MPLKPEISTPEPERQRVGYAVVGLGKLTAEELIPAIRTSQHARLAALVTSEKDKGLALAHASGLTDDDVYAYDDFERLAERDDVDAVFIVLPNSMHREFVERAARMGKHVLCEKPLSTNVADAQAMVDACRAAGVLLMTAYRCQYTPEHWAVRDAVQSGRLGTIRTIDSIHSHTEEDAQAWRMRREYAGGGPLVDVGIYSLNIIRFVLGKEPLWVFADLNQPQGDPRFAEIEERVAWMMGFEGGIVANCLTSYASRDTSALRVVGEAGKVEMDPAFNYTCLDFTLTDKEAAHRPRFASYDQFGNEVDHFAQCIREGKTPWTPGEEGVADHIVMDAIYESARTGQRVTLKLPAGQDPFRGERQPDLPQR
ncbi:glucose-fructose oxidoreductase [Deinococcus piscis]|uniref:Glucose-fructose oxidoreductase n=1 Tax=Deinococcus piscis TaxID=394230 RepID=A0ABQ3JYH8_9DEIO|nr:Gfo/Idh/MocA family oxidoreductase [Deinococcus piscis]GHF93337.1 glucose-fructose oxidoreductase [Deinococcus piscis]